MKAHAKHRFLCLLLSVLMIVSLLPTAALADEVETSTWEKVDFDKITADDVVAITMTKGDTVYVLPAEKNTSKAPTAAIGSVSNDALTLEGSKADYGWTITKNEDKDTYSIKNQDGDSLYVINSNAGVRVGSTVAEWNLDQGFLTAQDTQGNTRYMGVYATNPDWRCYKTIDNNIKDETLSFWKLKDGETPEPTATVEPTTDPTPAVTPVTIAEALAGEAGTAFTVKGVVTMVDGKNVYVQDATGGICLFLSAADSSIQLGDTVIGTGAKKVYRGLPELDAATVEKSEGMTLSAKETAIGALTAADVCTYVTIKDLTVTKIEGNNTTVTDSNGDSINLYKPVLGDKTLKVDDVITFTGAVGIFDSLQLRNTDADEITVKSNTPEPPQPTYNTVAEALAGEAGTSFTVKGVVTMVDGKNVFVQDETGGICLFLTAADSSIQLGDTVIGSGSRAVYRGMPQLSSATAEKSDGMTLSAKETTIGALTTADVCTYVQLKGLEVTEVYDNNGAYKNPNITLKDADGATIQIYKAVVEKVDGAWAVQVGDKVDVKAAVGINNETLQLRNTVASEITPAVEAKVGFVTDLAELTDGAKVVILNPANKMALSQTYGGYYNSGVPVTVQDDKLSGFGASEVWTVGVNADGTYTFSTADGKKLSMAAEKSSLPLDEVNPNWMVIPTEGGFYIENTGRSGSRVEWYSDKGYWSAYHKNNDGDLFIQQFYLVGDEIPEPPSGDVLKEGDKVVIYNASAEGSLGLDNSGIGSSLGNIPTDIREGAAYPKNGAYVFTVGVEGDYYTFSAGGKYLSTRDSEELFLADEKLDTGDSCAYWQLEQKGDGYLIKSKTARYNGNGVVVIEFYSDAFSGWTYKSDNPSIFVFNFYPVDESIKTQNDVTNNPSIVIYATESPIMQQAYTVRFRLDDLTPLEQLTVTVTLNGEPVTNLTNDGKEFSFIVPAEVTAVEKILNVNVQVTNKTSGDSYFAAAPIEVLDIPVFDNFTPVPGSKTGDDRMPLISVSVLNALDTDQATITINGEEHAVPIHNGSITWQPTEPLKEGRVSVKVEVVRTDGVKGEQTWSFIVGEVGERLYFGQLHSHTTYSDGSGTLDAALQYVRDLPESANVQFVAFTDHSNYFDTNSAANPEGALYDMSLASADSQNLWKTYRQTVADFNASQSDVIAIAGFEMTWSGGPGHINTFNSPGIVSRNNATLNQKTNDAGMKAYYALLSRPEGALTLSQFNHPGKTFGNFTDFSYWDAVTDSRIFLVEVGNGEGQIGAGGYYPSYEQYIMALDKGWHVAPTNNQDNHKGRWGNANDARDVILTDDFTEYGIYDAISAMRVYSTEDKNLEVYYTMNDLPLGSTISEVPEALNVNVQVSDPDASDRISKVEVVVNSGKVIHTWDDAAAISSGTLAVTLAPNYSYYFIRVTEADGDLAVTAPVWVGETLKLGISAFESETAMPVTGEELTLKTTLYNSEAKEATVKNITYTTNGSKVLGVDTKGYTVPASGTQEVTFKYTPDVARVMTITATVVMVQDGKEFTFTKDLTLDVQNADELVYIGIDASHHNEYVAGNYKDSMGNFANLAAEYAVRTVFFKTSDELIAACGNDKYKAIVLTAPSRRDGSSLRNPYENYTEDEIAAIVSFNAKGGMVVLTGWSDYYEHYAAFPAADHMAAQQNRILEALGSSLRIADDGTNDDVLNGGQTPRLYFDTYNMDNPLMAGVVVDPEHPNDRAYSEVFSHYGGASIYAVDASGTPSAALPETVCPAVYAHATTYSWDSDSDGLGGEAVPKYPVGEADKRLLIMATEELDGKGLIVVSGAAFLSNFEVQAQISNGSSDADTQKNYANYKVCENLISPLNAAKVSDIADVRAQTEEGFKFTIEGVVTSNASGYDKDTAFFDCIYVQDETAGICCFPVAGSYKVGDKVRITGTTDFYQGEPELQVISIAVIGEGEVAPQEVSAKDVTSRAVEGSLITVKGTVESFELANDLVQTIMVKDANGDVVRVFIDGYITTGNEVQNLKEGHAITVTGLASYDDTFNAPDGPFPRIRVRDRADVVITAPTEPTQPTEPTVPTEPTTPTEPTQPTQPTEPTVPTEPTQPTVPTEPTQPTNPTEPTQPTNPTQPTQPTNPTQPTQPTTPDKPDEPTTPDKPDEPTTPDQPTTPDKPDKPDTPDKPDKPDKPDTPDKPDKPDEPKKPCDGGDNCPSKVFTDVDRSAESWYHEAVDWAYVNKVTDGMTDTTFAPDAACTRAQAVTFLWRANGSPAPKTAKNPFADVPAGEWYTEAVLWAVENGITDGTSDSTFSPDDTCNRAHIVTFLFRSENGKAGTKNPFADVPAGEWYTEAVLWAVAEGITDGVDETHFAPMSDCTRAHIVTFLYRDMVK